jgi:DNA-binding ferritin-like protein
LRVGVFRGLRAEAGEVIGLAEEADDRGTVNMLDALRDAMEKDLWMLKAWSTETAKAWS